MKELFSLVDVLHFYANVNLHQTTHRTLTSFSVLTRTALKSDLCLQHEKIKDTYISRQSLLKTEARPSSMLYCYVT